MLKKLFSKFLNKEDIKKETVSPAPVTPILSNPQQTMVVYDVTFLDYILSINTDPHINIACQEFKRQSVIFVQAGLTPAILYNRTNSKIYITSIEALKGEFNS